MLSALLMGATSSEIGGLFAGGHGHKIAQGYGLFFWAGVVLYVATAWRVRAEGLLKDRGDPARSAIPGDADLPAPHFLDRSRRPAAT